MLEVSNVRLPGAETSFAHTFAAGEISVVLGANRAGKTDLCRLVAGLPTRASGDVRIDGEDLRAVGPRQRSVGMVYQAFINYPNLNVAENIASPLKAQGMAAPDLAARVDELAAKLRIAELLERRPAELSGGQQQRLAIARALAKGARVLLLDEPLVNLDFKLREALEVELRDLLRASETIVVYTSSDPRDAFNLGDQVLLLAGGAKVQAGRPIEVYETPVDLTAMQLLSDPGVNLFERDGVLCAIRPEHLVVEGAGEIEFSLEVTANETNGDESFLHGFVDARDWVVRSRGMLSAQAGDTLTLAARAADVRQFEA